MKMQMVDVLRQYKAIQPEVDEAIQRVIQSGRFILGEDVGRLEREIAEYLGMKHAVGCASGTDALQIAMMALGIGAGDEVVTTPFTFVATAETIALLGVQCNQFCLCQRMAISHIPFTSGLHMNRQDTMQLEKFKMIDNDPPLRRRKS